MRVDFLCTELSQEPADNYPIRLHRMQLLASDEKALLAFVQAWPTSSVKDTKFPTIPLKDARFYYGIFPEDNNTALLIKLIPKGLSNGNNDPLQGFGLDLARIRRI